MKKDILFFITLFIFAWCVFSFLASFMKNTGSYSDETKRLETSCGKKYPIDYVLYTNLFCEIKD